MTETQQQELARLEAAFEYSGGRGVDLAERIDELREAILPLVLVTQNEGNVVDVYDVVRGEAKVIFIDWDEVTSRMADPNDKWPLTDYAEDIRTLRALDPKPLVVTVTVDSWDDVCQQYGFDPETGERLVDVVAIDAKRPSDRDLTQDECDFLDIDVIGFQSATSRNVRLSDLTPEQHAALEALEQVEAQKWP